MAATTAGGGAGDQQVRTAGFTQEEIVAGPAPSRPPEPSLVTATTAVAQPPSPPPPPTTSKPAVTITTATRSTTPTTVQGPDTPIPAWTVPPGGPPPFPTPTIPGGSSWSNKADGVSVRMRMVPAAPVAGQPVTFYIDDVIAQDPCCGVALMFGDSPTSTNVTGGGSCDSPTSLKDLSITHTYAAPGAYEARLTTVTFPCGPVIGDPPHRAIHGAGIHACIVVGPGDAGAAGCPARG